MWRPLQTVLYTFSFYGCRDPEYEHDRDVTRWGHLCKPFYHILILWLQGSWARTWSSRHEVMWPLQTVLSHSHSMAAGILSTNVIMTSRGEVTFANHSIRFSCYGCRDPEYERDSDVTRRGDICKPFYHILILWLQGSWVRTPLHTVISHSYSVAAGILSMNVIVTSRGELTFANHSITFSFYGCRDSEYECDWDVRRRGDLCKPFHHILILWLQGSWARTWSWRHGVRSPLQTIVSHSRSMAAGILSTNVIVTSRGEVTFANHSITFSFYGCRNPEY